MTQSIREAKTRIATVIGVDISYITPPDERRFEPITLGIALAGLLLYAFLKGMVEALGKKLGEAVGEALADAITSAVQKLIKSGPEEPDIETAVQELARAVSSLQISAAQLKPFADAVQTAVEEGLVRQHIPRKKAQRIAQEVRVSALTLKPASLGV
jgi:hypothetical protein